MHTVTLPNFQVETEDKIHTTPSGQEAKKLFQGYADKKIPCEIFKNGKKQNEFKL
jgi:hypothetical protein